MFKPYSMYPCLEPAVLSVLASAPQKNIQTVLYKVGEKVESGMRPNSIYTIVEYDDTH